MRAFADGHLAGHALGQAVEQHARLYAERLAGYPDWPELASLPECVIDEVPASARPASADTEAD